MARISIRIALSAAIILATLIAAACSSRADSDSPPTPSPIPTPRPLPEHVTLANGITWLENAGLAVEPVEGLTYSDFARTYTAADVMQISVNGYSPVWVMEYPQTPTNEKLAVDFHPYGDFPIEAYPTLFRLNNLVYLVRGVELDTLDAVLMALWDMAPSTTLAPFGVPDRWPVFAYDAQEQAGQWLSDNYADRYVSIADPIFTTLGDAAHSLPLEPVAGRLPHPDSFVWVTQFIGYEELKTVVVDYLTGLPVAMVNNSPRLDMVGLKQAPLPVIEYVNAVDGTQDKYDELNVVVEWQLAEPVRHVSDELHENIRSYVIERALAGSADWSPIAWVTSDARNAAADGPPYTFIPPGGRALIEEPENSPPLLRYWDYSVEPGVSYDYRIYGCTNLERTTVNSQVVTATGGDPDPSTPDLGHHRSFDVDPECASGGDSS